jgi:hypothetical protein
MGKCAKRTQSAARRTIRRANCAKRTQFRQRGKSGKCFTGKELWRIAHPTRFGKTKPIVQNEPNSEQLGRGRRSHEETIMRNKAKLGHSGVPGRRHTGQSLLRKTNPIWPAGPGGRGLEGRGRRGQMRETNPIRPGVGGTPTSEKCKTKPIGAGIGGQGSEVSDLTPAPWTFAPNKANFGGSRIADKPFAGLELCPMPPTHPSSKTKPIWTAIGGQGSGVSNPAPDTGPLPSGLLCKTKPIRRESQRKANSC